MEEGRKVEEGDEREIFVEVEEFFDSFCQAGDIKKFIFILWF